MRNIPDDPIISSIERTGYPPWFRNYPDFDDDDLEEEDEDDEQRD